MTETTVRRHWRSARIALIGFCILTLAGAFYRHRNAPNPLDRFEVLAVYENPDRNSYAVRYRYYQAVHAATVFALSVGRGTPPRVGARTAIWPKPVLVHRLDVPAPVLSWQKPSGRLTAVFPSSVSTVSEGDFLPCYRQAEPASICFDRNWVDVIVAGSKSPDAVNGRMASMLPTPDRLSPTYK